MAQQTINNGESGLTVRTKLNAMFSELYTSISNLLGSKQDTITVGTTSQYYRGDKTMQTLNKSAVGLGNVDNTSDANKPVSNPILTALSTKVDKNGTDSLMTSSEHTKLANSYDSSQVDNLLAPKLDKISVGYDSVQGLNLPAGATYKINGVDILSLIVSGGSVFVGDFDASSGQVPTEGSGTAGAIKKGDYWRISVGGTIIGLLPEEVLVPGDVIFSKVNDAELVTDFFSIQGNQDLSEILSRLTSLENNKEDKSNKVNSLSSPSVTEYPTTQVVSDGLGLKENTANKENTTLDTSTSKFPTNNLVKTYVDTGLDTKQNSLGFTAENISNKSTNSSLGTSDILYPSQNAVKVYIDDNVLSSINFLLSNLLIK